MLATSREVEASMKDGEVLYRERHKNKVWTERQREQERIGREDNCLPSLESNAIWDGI